MVKELETVSYGVRFQERNTELDKKIKEECGRFHFCPNYHSSAVELYIHTLPWPHDGQDVLPCPWLWAQSCDLNWPISGHGISQRLKKHLIGLPAFLGSGHVPWEHTPHSRFPLSLDPRMNMYRADVGQACSEEPNPAVPATCSRATQLNPALVKQSTTFRPVNVRRNPCNPVSFIFYLFTFPPTIF